MIKIKMCGLSRPEDIAAANEILPDFIGFIFAKKSRRYVTPEKAAELKALLDPRIRAAGVFVREDPQQIAKLLADGTIDIAQLHGGENEEEIAALRRLTDKPVIKAFRIDGPDDLKAAEQSSADFILLDSGAGGTGTSFDWSLLEGFSRPYFLAGGLDAEKAVLAVTKLNPYALDVSSGIETDGSKDPDKMKAFAQAVRQAERMAK